MNSDAFDLWFRPKGFESERLYERLGALLLKRYMPTGGDLVMRRLRRHHPERRWVTPCIQSLRRYERRTRLNELIHLIGFIAFAILAVKKFASGSLTAFGLTLAVILNLILGLWPVVLQRYNRLRLYKVLNLYWPATSLKRATGQHLGAACLRLSGGKVAMCRRAMSSTSKASSARLM